MKALVYLAVHRLINSIKRIPRTPRLYLPTLFFLVILGAQALPIFLLSRLPAEHRVPLHAFTARALVEGSPGTLIAGVRFVLLLSVFTSLTAALNEGNLFFDPSDIDFLFPAPLSRRIVLLFRMVARYSGLLFPAVYLPLVLGGFAVTADAGMSPFTLWPGMLGAWLFLVSTTNLAQAAVLSRRSDPGSAALTSHARVAAERRVAQIRRAVSIAFTVLLVGAVLLTVRTLTSDSDRGLFVGVLRVVNGRALSVLLAPLAWAADLYRVPFEGWTAVALARLGGVVALAAGSFVALFSRDRDFYDDATELSARRVRVQAALRGGDTGDLLSQMAREGKLGRGRTIPTLGAGAAALLWKDLISLTRTPLRGWVNLLTVAVSPAIISLLAGKRSDTGVLIWMVMFAVQMSGVFLVGARNMLRRADLAKAFPIKPIPFLLGELSLGVVQLTVLGWFSLSILALTGSGRGPLLVAAYLAFPSLAALLIFVQASFVLLYPQTNDAAQSAISGMLGFVSSLCALAPGTAVGLLLHHQHAPSAVLGIAVGGVNTLAAGAALLIAARLWLRFDPSD